MVNKSQEVHYRIKRNKNTGHFVVEVKKMFGLFWTRMKVDEFKCEHDADYYFKLKHPKSFPVKVSK